jgi:hypothetical protein
MAFIAILVALYGSPTAETSIAREQAARVADTYQPQSPRVRVAARVRCVTTLDAKGGIESHRCDL